MKLYKKPGNAYVTLKGKTYEVEFDASFSLACEDGIELVEYPEIIEVTKFKHVSSAIGFENENQRIFRAELFEYEDSIDSSDLGEAIYCELANPYRIKTNVSNLIID